MDDKRNFIIKLKNYIESLGIVVNIGKTKARGNKGFFSNKGAHSFRIDISKNIDDEAAFSTLLHEFAHYIHYKYDSSLKSLDFVFDNYSDEIKEELINVTVHNVPKNFAKSLFDLKTEAMNEIEELSNKISQVYPDFKKSGEFRPIVKDLKQPVKYLLRYDCIKYFNNVYSVMNVEHDFEYLTNVQIYYIKLKSLQRKLSRINAKIRKMNNYYNQPSELWARFFELFFTDYKRSSIIAPKATQALTYFADECKCQELYDLKKILNL